MCRFHGEDCGDTVDACQNIKMRELGIDPYEYDTDREYSADEQELINEV